MKTKRLQGRPPRGSAEAGRERLLEGTRAFLRSRIDHSISLQDVARFSGVTPALVSYYFADKSTLLLASSLPVIHEATNVLDGILESEETYHDRLRELISLFIGFAARNGKILEIFIEAALESKSAESQRLILGAFERMQRFFAKGAQAGEWRNFDPTFFIFSVWGMCKFVGEPPAFPIRMFAPELEEEALWDHQANMIADLLVRGITDVKGQSSERAEPSPYTAPHLNETQSHPCFDAESCRVLRGSNAQKRGKEG